MDFPMVEKLLKLLKWGSEVLVGWNFIEKMSRNGNFLTVMKLKIKVILHPNYYTLKSNCSVPIL